MTHAEFRSRYRFEYWRAGVLCTVPPDGWTVTGHRRSISTHGTTTCRKARRHALMPEFRSKLAMPAAEVLSVPPSTGSPVHIRDGQGSMGAPAHYTLTWDPRSRRRAGVASWCRRRRWARQKICVSALASTSLHTSPPRSFRGGQ